MTMTFTIDSRAIRRLVVHAGSVCSAVAGLFVAHDTLPAGNGDRLVSIVSIVSGGKVPFNDGGGP